MENAENKRNIEIGNRIYEFRKMSNMTLKELAKKVGLTEATTQKYEKGKISKINIEVIKAFADALDVSASVLLGWSDITPDYIAYYQKNKTDQEELLIETYRNLDNFHQKVVYDLMCKLAEEESSGE